jgi:hypothetical protein
MKKCTDKDILRKSAKLRENQKVGAFTNFCKQFSEYRRAKGGQRVYPGSACQPYVETFRQPEKTEGT